MALRAKINFPKPRHGLQQLLSQHQHLHLLMQLESIMIPQLKVYYTLHSPFPTFFTSTCRSWWARMSPRTKSSTALRRRSSKPVCFRSANTQGSLRTNTTRSRGRPTKLLEGTEKGCLLSFPYQNKNDFIFFLLTNQFDIFVSAGRGFGPMIFFPSFLFQSCSQLYVSHIYLVLFNFSD